jgi:hypothetical protein
MIAPWRWQSPENGQAPAPTGHLWGEYASDIVAEERQRLGAGPQVDRGELRVLQNAPPTDL